MPCPKGQETSQQKQAGLITIDGHRGKEKLRASEMREHPQQGVCALRLPPGMNRKVQVSHRGACPRCQLGQKSERPRPQGIKGYFPRKPHLSQGSPPIALQAVQSLLAKIKSRATTYQKPNRYRGLGGDGNSLGPAMTKQL